MATFPDGHFDLIFTSPPYNLGMHPSGKGSGMHAGSGYTANGKTWNRVADLAGGYKDSDDAMPQEKYDAWQTQVVHECWRLLSDTGALFYNHKPRPMNGVLKLPIDYGSDLPLRQIVIWDRGVGMNFAPTHYLPKHEWIVIWAKPNWRLASRDMSGIGDVWKVQPEARIDHPAPFPVALPARAIETTGPKRVLDPFLGSGSTLVAAKAAGTEAVGIDHSREYCDLAVSRLQQESLLDLL